MNKENKNEYPDVRVLTRKDRKKLSELIKLFAERSGNIELTKMLPGSKGDGKPEADAQAEPATDQIYDLVKSVMSGLLEWVEAEVAEWFMDLIGVTDRDVYDALPFDIEVYIIDQLIAQKGFNNFFSRASALYKTIRG
jgi:hypothetical protein